MIIMDLWGPLRRDWAASVASQPSISQIAMLSEFGAEMHACGSRAEMHACIPASDYDFRVSRCIFLKIKKDFEASPEQPSIVFAEGKTLSSEGGGNLEDGGALTLVKVRRSHAWPKGFTFELQVAKRNRVFDIKVGICKFESLASAAGMPTYSAESLQVLKSLNEVADLRLPSYDLAHTLVAEEGSIVDAVQTIIDGGYCARFVNCDELQSLISQNRLIKAVEVSGGVSYRELQGVAGPNRPMYRAEAQILPETFKLLTDFHGRLVRAFLTFRRRDIHKVHAFLRKHSGKALSLRLKSETI